MSTICRGNYYFEVSLLQMDSSFTVSSYQMNMPQVNEPQFARGCMYYLLLLITHLCTPKRVKSVFLDLSSAPSCFKNALELNVFSKKAHVRNEAA